MTPGQRLRHALSDLVGGHSHDTADQIDDALEADARGRRALWISLAGLGVTAVLQAVVVAFSGSVALLGDTLHNVADAATALPLLAAFSLSRRAATKRFTYGFARSEDLAGLFVVAMITLSAIAAAWTAIERLLNPRTMDHIGWVALAGVIGFLGNEVVARYRITVGHQIGSAALVADGLHARTDGFTSLAVVLGAAGAALGWHWADPVIGLLIALAIVGVLRQAIGQVGGRLMDAVDPVVVDRVRTTLLGTPGVEGVGRLRVRWVGHRLQADAEVLIDPLATLAEAHAIAVHAEQHLVEHVPHLDLAVLHACPANASCH